MFRANAFLTALSIAILFPVIASAQPASGIETAMSKSSQDVPQPADRPADAGSSDMLANAQAPKDMEVLEVDSLIGIQTQDDKFVVVSKNGRYFLKGVLVDTWGELEIQSMEQLRVSKNTLDLNALGVNALALGAVSVGSGSKTVTVFVSPNCDDCSQLFQAMLKPGGDIQYHIFFVPSGVEDRDAAERISCVPDDQRGAGVVQAVVERNVSTLAQSESCDRRRYMEMLMLGDTLGIKTNDLPFMIRWDGRSGRFSPSLLSEWRLAE